MKNPINPRASVWPNAPCIHWSGEPTHCRISFVATPPYRVLRIAARHSGLGRNCANYTMSRVILQVAEKPAKDLENRRPAAFAADRMLARLARWLRLLGADVLWDPSMGGSALLKRARAEGRIVLTRDKRLKTAADALYLESNDFRGQLREVLARVPFDTHSQAFTRCSRCNSLLRSVPRELVTRRVPPFVYASSEGFSECERCGRIYWAATHPQRAIRELKSLGILA